MNRKLDACCDPVVPLLLPSLFGKKGTFTCSSLLWVFLCPLIFIIMLLILFNLFDICVFQTGYYCHFIIRGTWTTVTPIGKPDRQTMVFSDFWFSIYLVIQSFIWLFWISKLLAIQPASFYNFLVTSAIFLVSLDWSSNIKRLGREFPGLGNMECYVTHMALGWRWEFVDFWNGSHAILL